jgi:hypothetical protein
MHSTLAVMFVKVPPLMWRAVCGCCGGCCCACGVLHEGAEPWLPATLCRPQLELNQLSCERHLACGSHPARHHVPGLTGSWTGGFVPGTTDRQTDSRQVCYSPCVTAQYTSRKTARHSNHWSAFISWYAVSTTVDSTPSSSCGCRHMGACVSACSSVSRMMPQRTN